MRSPAVQGVSGEQDRRQPPSSLDGRLVSAAPGFEKLNQLFACGVIVPFAVALDDLEQVLSGLGAFAGSIERGRQVESRLMIERVCGYFLFQFSDGTNRLGLLGEIERCLHCLDGGIIPLDSGTMASVCLACSIAPVAT